jgi:TolB-like protein/Tfp pilus assembly protein PilF
MNAKASFIAELQRRKVFKVGAAYLVVAWLAVQAASIAFPTFEAPLWALRVFILVALLGFPVVLVLTWMIDLTPEGVKLDPDVSGSKRVMAAAALLVVLALGWYFYGQPSFRKGDPITPTAAMDAVVAAVPAVSEKSIAVLPFENLSDDKANAYFAEGMQDEILTRLAGIGDLKVISRTSTKRYASRPDNLKVVGSELGAAHILEGSVQKSGDSVRVNVQLIDARTDTHLWAQTFDRKLENVFAVESEVAQQIADVLKARLSPQETRALAQTPTTNADAYDHFLRAEFQWHRAFETAEVGSYSAADDEYQKAISLDPDFALAYARRAYSQLAQHWNTQRVSPARLVEVKAWIDRSLTLAPELPAAHSALAYYNYWGLRHYAEGMAEFERTVQLSPNNADALAGIGYIHRRLGQWNEALASLQRVIAISPRDNLNIDEYGTTLVVLRRYKEAYAQFLRGRAISTDNSNGQDFLMRDRLFGFGDVAGARKIFDPMPPWRISYYTLLAGDLYHLVNARVYPDLYERKFDAALKQWDSAEQVNDDERLTGRVARVAIQIVASRQSSIQPECKALAPLLAAKLRKEPDSLSWLQQTSWVMVCLGRNAEAMAAARHATEIFPLDKDKYFGTYQLEGLAEISAHAGAPDEAIKILGQMLAMPAGQSVSVERLKRDPLWDPLREDPRFQALINGAGP